MRFESLKGKEFIQELDLEFNLTNDVYLSRT